jgi:hypothetical protein
MPIFALLLFFIFPVAPYQNKSPGAGPVTAIVEAFNLLDLLGAFVRGPMRLVIEQHRSMARDESVKLLPVAESTAYGDQRVIETDPGICQCPVRFYWSDIVS